MICTHFSLKFGTVYKEHPERDAHIFEYYTNYHTSLLLLIMYLFLARSQKNNNNFIVIQPDYQIKYRKPRPVLISNLFAVETACRWNMQTCFPYKLGREINASYIFICWNICFCYAVVRLERTKDNTFTDFLRMPYLAERGQFVPHPPIFLSFSFFSSLSYIYTYTYTYIYVYTHIVIDVVVIWLVDRYTITMQAEKPISTTAEAGLNWWARGLGCKRSHREAHHGIGDLIDPDVYEDREDSIVPLVLIPISGYISYTIRTAWQWRLSMTIYGIGI